MWHKISPECASEIQKKATILIQNCWRRELCELTTKNLAKLFLSYGPTIQLQSFRFEQVVTFLRSENAISATKRCLQRVCKLCDLRSRVPVASEGVENINVRVFMAAYMIASHPERAFESQGQLEKTLIKLAQDLTDVFGKICTTLQMSKEPFFLAVPEDVTTAFSALLHDYLHAFNKWKAIDQEKTSRRIIHGLNALYKSYHLLHKDEPINSKVKSEICNKIDELRNKLKLVAGADALRRFDDQQAQSSADPSESGGLTPGLAQEVSKGQPADSLEGNAGSAQMSNLHGRMTNDRLAHELLLDPTFQFDDSGESAASDPALQNIRATFHRAFWDSLQDDLEMDVPCYGRLLKVFAEIKRVMLELADCQDEASIDEAIDLGLIERKIEDSVCIWEFFVGSIQSCERVLDGMQAVSQKEEWQQVNTRMVTSEASERPRSLCAAVEFLLNHVNAIQIDAANKRLRSMAPFLKEHGIDYERRNFQDMIRSGVLTLEKTQSWIRKTLEAEVEANAIDINSLIGGKEAAVVALFNAAMLALVFTGVPIREETMPETLLLDVDRLTVLQKEFHFCVMACTLVATATGDKQITQAIVNELESKAARIIDLKQLPSRIIKTLSLRSDKSSLENRLTNCFKPSDPVHNLMNGRVRSVFAGLLEGRGSSYAQHELEAINPFLPRIKTAVQRMYSVVALNWAVHKEYYKRVIASEALVLGTANRFEPAAV